MERTLAHYRIVDHLGAGGMGEVYLAEDTSLKRKVALKILPPRLAADAERISRFRREAEALATLNHPNIVTVHSVEVATSSDGDDIHFLTMEYVEGNTLGDILPEQGLTRESFFELAVPLAEALAAAHDKGIVHRDLKPRNVMVREDGVLKVVDFGLAIAAPPAPPASVGDGVSQLTTEQPLTREGAVIGTMPYMSPEQLEGKSVDGRSDVFSLGVVLYEMATGRRPFNDETAASLIADIMSGTPREVDTVRRDLPHHLARIIRHCLEKDPNHRFQTARDVSNELVDLRKEGTDGAAGRESQSVAVLPFTNVSPDPENEYFADGLTDELISALSTIRELRVPSRTSTGLFKGAGKSMVTIAQELDVRYVVEGTVRRVGNSVRITAQLIDGRSDAHLWAERYSGTLDNIFDLQESLSRRIVEALEVTLAPQEERSPAARTVPTAYDAYLRGRSYLERATADGRRRAIEYFNLAIASDPAYARAHAALATAYLQELTLGGVPGADLAAQTRAAAERALELDPTTGTAHATLGWLALAQGWDWSGAEAATRRAVELEPHDTATLHVYSFLLMAQGRQEEAMAASRRLLELDPLSPLMNTHHVMQYYYARKYDRALEHAHRTVAMDPTYTSVHGALGAIYVQMGRNKDAVAAYEDVMTLSGTPRETIEEFRSCYEKEGMTGFWGWRAKTRPPREKAVAYAAMGELDQAFAWLRRALQENPLGLLNLNVEPGFDPLRSDPRFDAQLDRINYPKRMRVGGDAAP